nr:LuxR C-terminal-related transcriptional regulator [Micromonospora sp. DSM 115978]
MGAGPSESITRAGRPLLAAKLAPAPLPTGLEVARPRLFELLDHGVRGPVTVLTAPAGYGKSVLLDSWRRTRGGQTGWLSVEPGDDGARLWPYLLMALHPDPVVPPPGSPAVPDPPADLGSGMADTIDVPRVVLDGPVATDFLAQLACDLDRRSEPVVLIVDDFHLVRDEAVSAALEFLLRHADRFRLVVAGRTAPALALRRWRMAGRLTEVGPAELAFDEAETAELFAGHGPRLPAGAATVLWERTEGWPAGLRLAALGLRGAPDPGGFLAGFDGQHPDVAAYLAEEVLSEVDERTRDALTLLSVSDRPTPGLCDVVTGGSDGEKLLAEAAEATGFVVSDDGDPPRYRFHRMLGELLRARLRARPPADLVDLRRRVAEWFARNGIAGDAIRHALHGRRWALAADLLARHWPELVPCGRGAERPEAPPEPPPPEVVRADPAVGLAYALDRLAAGDLAGATHHLRPDDQPVAPPTDASVTRPAGHARSVPAGPVNGGAVPPAGWLVEIRAVLELALAEQAGEVEAVRARCAGLLAPVRSPDGSGADAGDDPPGPAVRAIARTVLGGDLLAAGELVAAEAELAAGAAGCASAGLSRAERLCTARLALTLALVGRLAVADGLARAILDGRGRDRSTPLTAVGYAYLTRAVTALARDHRAEVEIALPLADRIAVETAEPALNVYAALVRAESLLDQGEPVAAYRAVLDGHRWLAGRPGAAELADRFTVLGEDLRVAATATPPALPTSALPASALPTSAPPGVGGSTAVRAVADARAYLRTGDARAAARALPDWDGPAGAAWPLDLRLSAGLLDALAARATGDHRRAARTLERVLELAEPDGHRRPFGAAEQPVRDLLAAHLDTGTAYWATVTELICAHDRGHRDGEATADPGRPGEPLTERELTILRYLQSILSNVEIAAELSLSVNTVKTHVRNIYRKLDTTRRRDAVRRARELRLL